MCALPAALACLRTSPRAVDAGALAVPQGEDAVILGAGEEVDLLAAPDRGRGEVLVEAGLEMDVMALEEALGLPQAGRARPRASRDSPR